MQQAAQITMHVVRGFVHVLRVDLYRTLGIPYPWLKTSGTVRFKTDQSWPQPSPISANMPHAVLHVAGRGAQGVPRQDRGQIPATGAFSWLSAIAYLKRTPHLDCPDDATFSRYMTKIGLCLFPDGRPGRRRSRAPREERYLQRIRPQVGPGPGEHGRHLSRPLLHRLRLLLPQKAPTGSFELLGIAMVDRQFRLGELIRPSDGNSWKRAKMHVLQGATYLSLFVDPPEMPLPDGRHHRGDQDVAPEGAPDRQAPRAAHVPAARRSTTPCCTSRTGPGFNDPRLYYTAFSGAGASQYSLFEYSFAGLPGHAAFPPYTFGISYDRRRTDYLSFLRGYHEIILGVRAQGRRRRGARRRGAGVGEALRSLLTGVRPRGRERRQGAARRPLATDHLELLGGPQRGSLGVFRRSPWSTSRRGCASPRRSRRASAPST